MTREKEDFPPLLGVASLVYLSQLKGGCNQNVNFWITLMLRYNHYALEIGLDIHDIIKLKLNTEPVAQSACFCLCLHRFKSVLKNDYIS